MRNKLRFYFKLFIYDVDSTLDGILNKELESGVSECIINGFYIEITFNTGVKAKFWNTNKWFAWLGRGIIGNYIWDDARPRKKTMWRLKKEIEKYFVENH